MINNSERSNVSRRAFLRRTAAAAVGTSISPNSFFVCYLKSRGDTQIDSDAAISRNIVGCWPAQRAKSRPVPMEDVTVSGFLGRRIDRNRASLLAGLESRVPRAFEARAAGEDLPDCTWREASDTDLHKWIEGACYVYSRTRDDGLREEIDRIAGLIVKCQKPDGYINTQVPPNKRFGGSHDLYVAGHFFEAAVAHRRATGKKDLLDAACRFADYLIAEYEQGNPYYEKGSAVNESELGFLRLGRETKHSKYVEFGATLARKMSRVGPEVSDIVAGKEHKPLHAVCVGYLLAGMADIYLETGRRDMIEHLPGLREELAATRMYPTGGIGHIRGEYIHPQPFHQSLDLGHREGLAHSCETCGGVAQIIFNWRMHAITGWSECFDVIERVLYNHFLGALSLDNLANFYYNPLNVTGDLSGMTDARHSPMTGRTRLPDLHRTSCCMSNAWRFLGALPEYVFSRDAEGIFVNLYTAATVDHTLPDGRKIALSVKTDYPHDGKVLVRFEGKQPASFKLRLRIPGWCRNAEVEVGGSRTAVGADDGYFTIDETWRPGDEARLDMPMPPRMIVPDPRVEAFGGLVAFARGPLVYCLEKPDVHFPVEEAKVNMKPVEVPELASVEWRGDLLGGINILHIPGLANSESVNLPLVPWYARANRSNDSRWLVMLSNLKKINKKNKK